MTEKQVPFCLCLAGPNGSGKSTLTKGLRSFHPLANWIDPDIVASEVRADPAHESLEQDEVSKIAFGVARRLRVKYAQGLEDFGFETVYSHFSNLNFLAALKKLGYFVQLNFVCTDNPAINVGRVRNRVRAGGHSVPEDKIIQRYERSLENLGHSIHLFDRLVFFDNSNSDLPGRVFGQITRSGGEIGLRLLNLPFPPWIADVLQKKFIPGIGGFLTIEEDQKYQDSMVRESFLEQFLI